MSRKVVAAICLLLLAFTETTVSANEVEDLYTLYNMQYVPEIPDDISGIIKRYQDAERYTFMYQYVATSDFDKENIKDDVKKHKQKVAELKDALLSGYDKNIDEIYLLEDEYRSELQKLQDAKSSLKSLSVESSSPNVGELPTKEEYTNALNAKAELLSNHSIGSIANLTVPIHAQYMLESSEDNIFTYLTVDGASVSCIFNGVVESVDNNIIVVNHYNGIKTYYTVSTSKVNAGDTVYQGQIIGVCNKYPSLQLTLDDKRVDLSKLFKEVSTSEES